jgi:hypothetical protein
MVAFGCFVLAGAPRESVSADDLARLINQDSKAIQQAHAKGRLDQKNARKVKGTALLIAHYAQTARNKDNAQEMATLRDLALKVLKAVENEKIADAKALAAGLSAKPKPDPGAKLDVTPLNPILRLEFVMRVFSSPKLGGYGLEMELDKLVDVRGPLAGAEQAKAIDMANKMVLIGLLAEAYAPESDQGKKTRKDWMTFSLQLRQSSLALAEAARTGKDIGIAANAVSVSCTKCHDIFKPPPGGS